MEKIDARKLTPREITEKRKIVVKLREKGMSNNEVAQIVGISPQTTSLYYSNYKKYGKDSFKVKYLNFRTFSKHKKLIEHPIDRHFLV